MKVICDSNDCPYNESMTEFEVDNLAGSRCPKCKGNNIIPAWIKQFKKLNYKSLSQQLKTNYQKLNNIHKNIDKITKEVEDKRKLTIKRAKKDAVLRKKLDMKLKEKQKLVKIKSFKAKLKKLLKPKKRSKK